MNVQLMQSINRFGPDRQFCEAVHTFPERPEVTWIGPNPFARGTCLGFEDGSVSFSSIPPDQNIKHHQASPSKEAINGVASIQSSSLPLSTRSDVTFLEIADSKIINRVSFNGGAHGVVSTKSGYFVAPKGDQRFAGRQTNA